MVTFENVVTTTVLVGWLWTVFLAAIKSRAAAEKGVRGRDPYTP